MNARERARRIERLMQGEADIERARRRIARESGGDVSRDDERAGPAYRWATAHEPRMRHERCTTITINVGGFAAPTPEDAGRETFRQLKDYALKETREAEEAIRCRTLELMRRMRAAPDEPAPKFKVGDRVTLRGYRGAGRVVEATTIQARVFWPFDARFLVHDEPDPLDTFAADHGLVADPEPQPAEAERPLAVGDRVRSTQNRAVRGTVVADYDSVRRWAVRWDGHGVCRHKPDDIERIEGGE